MKRTEESRKSWDKHSQDIIKKFLNLEEAPPEWTMPFTPWCGDRYWTAPTKILFVGKSVGCFNDMDAVCWTTPLLSWQETSKPNPDSPKPNPVSLTRRYVTEKVASLNPFRPEFWLIPMLISSAFSASTTEPDELVQSFAWSNLYKVCNSSNKQENGLPTQQDLSCLCSSGSCCSSGFCLRHESARWLVEEIKILRPDLVVLGIADRWNGLAKALLLKCGKWDKRPFKLCDEVVKQMQLGFQPKGIWVTRHFTSWNGSLWHGRMLLDMKRAMD